MGGWFLKCRGVAAALLLAEILALAPGAARADETLQQFLHPDDPGLLSVGGGMFDFLHNNKAPEARAEYDFAHGLYFIKPMIGVFGTTKKAAYAYAGLNFDLHVGNRFVIVPNAAFGYYHKGKGKDLGEAFEFKTGVRFDYRFKDASRIGLAFDHISNAGFSKKNPGEENILLMFSFPIGGW